MENVFDYEDIQLIFVKCIVNSCLECDILVMLGGYIFKFLVVLVNMQMVIDENIAVWFVENGYFYIMYCFELEKCLVFVQDMKVCGLIFFISVGVKENDYEFIWELKVQQFVLDYIIIDIVYGYFNVVISMI